MGVEASGSSATAPNHFATTWNHPSHAATRQISALSRRTGCTMLYETNQRLLATSQRAPVRLVAIPGLQRPQSPLWKRSASPDHWLSLPEYGYVRRGAEGPSPYCERQSVCFIICRRHQRDDAKHSGHEQPAVAGHGYNRRDFRSGNSEGDSQYSKRKFGGPWLLERWNQQGPRPDYYLATRTGTRQIVWSLSSKTIRAVTLPEGNQSLWESSVNS
jgi:hypothetical protein